MKIQPVILAGGTGSRLWPLSRSMYPKQVIDLISDQSLLQNTLERVSTLPDVFPPLVVIGEEHRFLVKNQIEELNLFSKYTLLLEPVGRNTAPAICGAAIYAEKTLEKNTVLLVLPADHLIRKPGSFVKVVTEAAKLAQKGKIVTFGIVPDRPETGYGYIAKGDGNAVHSFVEKPDLETAKKYLAGGDYLWNSGMFAYTATQLLNELEHFAPELVTAMRESVEKGSTDGVFYRFDKESMKRCPSDSIDYALMEKTDSAAVVEADIGWSDVGSWQALWEVSDKDDRENVISGDVIAEDVTKSLIRADDKLVAAIGLNGMMVVETPDALLVAPIDRSQDVKKIVKRLKKENREEFELHKTVYRPWGSYTSLEMQDRFQIKRITVTPGAKLSSQMHHHRHEHWVVVSGTALVLNGEKEILLHEDESTYIPAGTTHRLGNPGVIPLELIEVQVGSYLGEDDIVRFDDVYGR